MLTQQDVSKLLNEPAATSRVRVAQKVAQHHASGDFQTNELLIAEQIFRLLLRDTEAHVRAALAESLKDNDAAPKDVIQALALDADDDVSVPILKHSEVLGDEDLVEIIQTHDEIVRHIAIANRKNISHTVSAALVETENEEVVTHLVRNPSANISDESYQKIVDDFPQSDSVMGFMVQRSNLPVSVVESLLSIVSESVAQELKQRYRNVARQLDEETHRTRERMTLQLLDTTTSPAEIDALVDQLYEGNRLTPSIILTSLCRGNFPFFEVSLAKVAGIPTENARKLINDKGSLGFKSLYGKAGLPESMFEACRLVLDVMREVSATTQKRRGSIHYANSVVEKILTRAENREIDNLAYIIALIRQNVR